MAPRNPTLEARVLERIAQKTVGGRTVGHFADASPSALLPPRPPSAPSGSAGSGGQAPGDAGPASAPNAATRQSRQAPGGRDRGGGGARERGTGGRAEALPSEDDYWPEYDDGSDSAVSSVTSSEDSGADDPQAFQRPRAPRGTQAPRSRSAVEKGSTPAPTGGSLDAQSTLQARVLANYAASGGGSVGSGAGRARSRRKDGSSYDCEAAGEGGGQDSLKAFLNGGLQFCNRKDVKRFIRRRRRTIRTTLAAVLGMYVAGLFLAAQGTFEPMSGELPIGSAELHDMSLQEAKRRDQLQELRKNLPREAWRAAGLGEPPQDAPPASAAALREQLKERARLAALAARKAEAGSK